MRFDAIQTPLKSIRLDMATFFIIDAGQTKCKSSLSHVTSLRNHLEAAFRCKLLIEMFDWIRKSDQQILIEINNQLLRTEYVMKLKLHELPMISEGLQGGSHYVTCDAQKLPTAFTELCCVKNFERAWTVCGAKMKSFRPPKYFRTHIRFPPSGRGEQINKLYSAKFTRMEHWMASGLYAVHLCGIFYPFFLPYFGERLLFYSRNVFPAICFEMKACWHPHTENGSGTPCRKVFVF